MNKRNQFYIFSALVVGIAATLFLFLKPLAFQKQLTDHASEDGYIGSRSCIECHERFYELWSPSHHGKAMQPVEDVLIAEELKLPGEPIQVGDKWYDVSIEADKLYMLEKGSQNMDEVSNRFEALWALGGRNIYYFLTPFEGGKLQTMPLAYDLNRNEWYSNPQSAVRHFVDDVMNDEEVEWTHSLYTFNTTCHSCHVSQLNTNYDTATNTYHTTWKEPGINCETCHGPSEEHVKTYREAAEKDEVPEDIKLIVTSTFTPDQHNSSCATCHAKGEPLTQSYPPGEPFFQHFNLVTLESPDYYPDGRDLGENYTMTTWFQSSCASNSDLHCVTCHTSSGRYRFENHDNDACSDCHQDKANNFLAHSHHKAEDSLTCVSCHMPKTEFARMTRSDHSMRPPMPASTLEFESPNSCNICHDEEDAAWANNHVINWHGNYQDKALGYARLIQQGRTGHFDNNSQMLDMINNSDVDIIFRSSMMRILINNPREENEKHFLNAINDESPLIRASAAEALVSILSIASKDALLKAAQDSFRVVRNRASVALARFPNNIFTAEELRIVEHNFNEYEEYLMTRPDTWSSHYNLGIFYQGRGMYQQAIESYKKATQLENEVITPLVNASLAYSVLGNFISAEECLKRALSIDADNSAANLNYGLLLGELSRFDEAKSHFKRALESDSTLGVAAYNLAVISAQTNMDDALKYGLIAFNLNPENPKYGYTYAFYLNENGESQNAISILNEVLKSHSNYIDAYLFLGNIYENNQNVKAAINLYEQGAKVESIPAEYQQNFLARANMLRQMSN